MKRMLRAHSERAKLSLLRRSAAQPFRFCSVVLVLAEMRREATAVVWGRLFSGSGEGRADLTELRRGVHRVEKGLIMRPRRVPFGEAIVPALVESFVGLARSGALPADDRRWAADVLSQYFAVCSGCDAGWLLRARQLFEASGAANAAPAVVPAPRSSYPPGGVDLAQLEALAVRRRSVRWFEDRPVDPAAVDRALLVAAQAPSACNRQNLRFHLVYGRAGAQEVLDVVGGTKGFSHQVPAVAVVIGRLAGYRHTFDRHAIYVDGGLAAMGFLYALETQGLSSCCINFPDVGAQDRAIRTALGLRPDEQVIMLIALGHADPTGLVPASKKRGLESLRSPTP